MDAQTAADSNKLEHARGMIYAGFLFFFSLEWSFSNYLASPAV